ncbi:MAG: DNA ligase D [Acetobacteraceae bacterium]|nr:DNA ligase D [Acetobacteraceae bacterium]
MPPPQRTARDTSIRTYRARRDFLATPEPRPRRARHAGPAPIFVVQKHDARRLHWDFRLEHGDVLWSWAVPKGPSLDPADKRLAVRTEDHPRAYADFAGVIPAGQYGAGTVEIWDRGTWEPVGSHAQDPAKALADGELKFRLQGSRLNGNFVLVRLRPRPKERAENWLLIKERDAAIVRGADAPMLERRTRQAPTKPKRTDRGARRQAGFEPPGGAKRGAMPKGLAPQLATLRGEPPQGADWLSEVKFDGYRLLAFKSGQDVRLITRNGQDWTARLPTIAASVARLASDAALLDGELVAIREDGISSFALLQQALSDGIDHNLSLYLFDLLYMNGWVLSDCRLADRKQILAKLSDWRDALRYSDHVEGRAGKMLHRACSMKLEGIICKRRDAPYRSGRGNTWLKLKCQGREEFIVLGFTPPSGSRTGLGSLHLGYRTEAGALEYAGGVGSGFTAQELAALRRKLDALIAPGPPDAMVYAGDPPDRAITWVRPELVIEVQFAGWSGAGRIRHAAYLGIREDKSAGEVVRASADPDAPRVSIVGDSRVATIVRGSRPVRRAMKPTATMPRPRAIDGGKTVSAMHLTHADRELWPGITKRDLADYWLAVSEHALPEIAGRPLALVRCPEGIEGSHFFQKHATPGFSKEIRASQFGNAPYLVIGDVAGLLACAQVSAVELHAWGSREPDVAYPDRIVFDLDPGDGVAFTDVVRAAHEVRARLKAAGLAAFCRTTGGKGLHVVAPVEPSTDWDTTRAWCRGFAEAMVADASETYVSRLPKNERRGKILVDWLRNGLGSTAIASFSPRARPGATVATPLAWREVTEALDPAAFTLQTVPRRLKKPRANPWKGFEDAARPIPQTNSSRRH